MMSCAETPSARAPQWSPSTEDGTTRPLDRQTLDLTDAAMEPVHGGRDDPPSAHAAAAYDQAAMEPVHGGRDDRNTRAYIANELQPQWSPSTEDGTTCRYRRWPTSPPGRRNGARPRRTGRHLDDPRTRRRTAGRNGARPRRTGRPHDDGYPQSSRDGRNGARPRRTGRPGPVSLADPAGGGRNGARPRRTGRPQGLLRDRSGLSAAMEPVHGGRDDIIPVDAATSTIRPQWSPSTEDGTTATAR